MLTAGRPHHAGGATRPHAGPGCLHTAQGASRASEQGHVGMMVEKVQENVVRELCRQEF
jgi:hypothetical protein